MRPILQGAGQKSARDYVTNTGSHQQTLVLLFVLVTLFKNTLFLQRLGQFFQANKGDNTKNKTQDSKRFHFFFNLTQNCDGGNTNTSARKVIDTPIGLLRTSCELTCKEGAPQRFRSTRKRWPISSFLISR